MMNHGLHGLGSLTLAMLCVLGIGNSLAADPAISVSAKQRYPWNGLVDLKFTITGDSGTKYDTSFTNITMEAIRKSDGISLSVPTKINARTF